MPPAGRATERAAGEAHTHVCSDPPARRLRTVRGPPRTRAEGPLKGPCGSGSAEMEASHVWLLLAAVGSVSVCGLPTNFKSPPAQHRNTTASAAQVHHTYYHRLCRSTIVMQQQTAKRRVLLKTDTVTLKLCLRRKNTRRLRFKTDKLISAVISVGWLGVMGCGF